MVILEILLGAAVTFASSRGPNVDRRFVIGGLIGTATRLSLPPAAARPVAAAAARHPFVPAEDMSVVIGKAWQNLLTNVTLDESVVTNLLGPTSDRKFMRLAFNDPIRTDAYIDEIMNRRIDRALNSPFNSLMHSPPHPPTTLDLASEVLFRRGMWSRIEDRITARYPGIHWLEIRNAFDQVPERELIRLAYPEVTPGILEVLGERMNAYDARDHWTAMKPGGLRPVGDAWAEIEQRAFTKFPSSYGPTLRWHEPLNRMASCSFSLLI